MRRGMNAGEYVGVNLRGVTQRQRVACSCSCATAAALTRRSGASCKCAASRPSRRMSGQAREAWRARPPSNENMLPSFGYKHTIKRCIQLPERRGAALMQRERHDA